MNKNIKTFLVIVPIAILIFAGYQLSNKPAQPKSMMQKDTEVEKTNVAMMQKDTEVVDNSKMMEKSGKSYVEYSKAELDTAASNRRVLFFYASWCPTCIPADADLEANASKIPSDVTVIRVNYNDPETDMEEKELAKKYGVTYQHTFVQIDSQGNEVTKWNGGKTEELINKIK